MIYLYALLLMSLSWYLPWWILPVLALGAGWLSGSRRVVWEIGLITFCVWAGAAFYLDARAYGVISQRMTELLQLPHRYLVVAITGAIGATLAMVFAWAGSVCRRQV